MGFTRAIVRELSSSYTSCISDFPLHHLLNLEKAREQHSKYINLLKDIGLEIIKLEGDKRYPDCCFIEDNAIIHGKNAVITRMGINSRMGEVEAIQEVLGEYKNLHIIQAPATIEGGDVIHIEEKNLLISGISQRTNQEGIRQLHQKLGIDVKVIESPNIVHLKSYVTYLGNNTMLTTRDYEDYPTLKQFTKLVVEEKEDYAANSLNINDTVIIPSGFNKTKEMLMENGFEVETLDMSEFQKCEGALTCLSLPF
ncbi:MAG: dimethylarginine dimethylaminohydrolase family protein [Candidatus Heimdallarchaeota archaeon]